MRQLLQQNLAKTGEEEVRPVAQKICDEVTNDALNKKIEGLHVKFKNDVNHTLQSAKSLAEKKERELRTELLGRIVNETTLAFSENGMFCLSLLSLLLLI